MDSQNYPRNRTSNRIHQPEALDSKTCPTYPLMRSGHSIPFQSNREYLFKFSIIFFFVQKKNIIFFIFFFVRESWPGGGLCLCPLHSNRPTFKPRSISESRFRQPEHITRQGLSQCGDIWELGPVG